MRRTRVVRIGPPRHVVALPGSIAARIGIATLAAGVTTIVRVNVVDVIAIGMSAAVVVEAMRIVMVEAPSIVAIEMATIIVIEAPSIVAIEMAAIIVIEAPSIVPIEVAAVILIEAARIVVVEAAAVIAVEPPVAAIPGVCITARPHHVPMRVLSFGIQLVVIFAYGSAVVPVVRVAGRSHLPKHLANAATALGLPGRRSTSATWSRLVIPSGWCGGTCIAGRSLTR